MGALIQLKVNWHRMEEVDRLQLLEYYQLKLLEYLALNNQNIQIDAVLVYLRMIALLQKWADPNYGNCISIINEVKKRTKQRQLTATLLYLIINPALYPTAETDLTAHLKEFFNMLIENRVFEYEIGPPFSAEICLPDEKVVWPSYHQILDDIDLYMTRVNTVKSDERVRLSWTAGMFTSKVL